MLKPVISTLKQALAWYDARIGILGLLKDGINTIPGTRDDIALDAASAARVAHAIDRGIGKALITDGDGAVLFSYHMWRDPKESDKTLKEAWL